MTRWGGPSHSRTKARAGVSRTTEVNQRFRWGCETWSMPGRCRSVQQAPKDSIEAQMAQRTNNRVKCTRKVLAVGSELTLPAPTKKL